MLSRGVYIQCLLVVSDKLHIVCVFVCEGYRWAKEWGGGLYSIIRIDDKGLDNVVI